MKTQQLLNNVCNNVCDLRTQATAAMQLVEQAQAQHNNWRVNGTPCSMQVHNLEVAAAALKEAFTHIAQAAHAASGLYAD